ncbi:PocR ligand-binding domain-containing protein [Peptoniphilus harei]|uniref:PocR ligand-binding domain-containing protein n=1 Tax=Peptoniphilus TaxID=162289 RepID=UPI00254DC50F|nr:PocR ligand-binding domain-containing protein [Peptoniphilus harei]MDK7377127.1 PocR ligand-binding domain-containing protein [Peptoniphilus harei]MDK7679442.1 PocR ligand-binding domain-containing protein [Peptoniphilus harei]
MNINKKYKHIPNIKINEKYTDGRSRIDIYSIFGKEYLEEIQRVISDVTGLAFVTIDYKGEPLTEMTNFSKRCRYIRENVMCKKICELSDASGAIRSAVSKKTSIYFCPFNLLEVAIPIVINDKYLGAFIGGQVICEDAPEKVLRMQDQLLLDEIDLESLHLNDIDVNSKKYTFTEFESIVRLVELIISEIIKKELISSYHESKNKKRIKDLEEKVEKLEGKNLELKNKILKINNNLNKIFLNDMMESLSNLALIEEAKNTSQYSEYLRNYFINSIEIESDSINFVYKTLINYFKMKEIQYKDRFKYEINIDDDVKECSMPFKILIPYTLVMCYLGLNFKEDEYHIEINVKREEDNIIILINDNGVGISKETFERLKDIHNISGEVKNMFEYIKNLEDDFKKISNGKQEINIFEDNEKVVISIKYPMKN